jgi:hypothetical protein
LGINETSIATVDADGVALAAIQGLHQLVKEKDGKIEAQQHEIAELRTELGRVNTNHETCEILRGWKSPKRSTA